MFKWCLWYFERALMHVVFMTMWHHHSYWIVYFQFAGNNLIIILYWRLNMVWLSYPIKRVWAIFFANYWHHQYNMSAFLKQSWAWMWFVKLNLEWEKLPSLFSQPCSRLIPLPAKLQPSFYVILGNWHTRYLWRA